MKGQQANRTSLYAEVTDRIIAEMEEGNLPWVQPWDSSLCEMAMPVNAGTGRRYSGINILLLWCEGMRCSYGAQKWLTYRQAASLGGYIIKGEKGTIICYADRFTPSREAEAARSEEREARQVTFFKRFTVFNVDQCEGLPEDVKAGAVLPDPVHSISVADELIAATGAKVQIGGAEAFYVPSHDFVQVPPQAAFHIPLNWYRTMLHELGHWTGHASRLDRDQKGKFGSEAYAREELVAEMTAAFTCAQLGITPTVRHSDYIASWLTILKNDEKAIFRAASQASKAADLLLSFSGEGR